MQNQEENQVVVEREATEVDLKESFSLISQRQQVLASCCAIMLILGELPNTKDKKPLKKLRKRVMKDLRKELGTRIANEITEGNYASLRGYVDAVKRSPDLDKRAKAPVLLEVSKGWRDAMEKGLEKFYNGEK